MSEQVLHRAALAVGTVELPGDKSIAHRAAIIAALSDGSSEIINFPTSEDPQSTLRCLRQLGVQIDKEEKAILVHGRGLRGLQPPSGPLDCGNSGTTMRLLAGVLAGQSFPSTLTGDASLSRRPMERVAAPLREMGARITLQDGRPPIRLEGSPAPLKPIKYTLPVPSAQVKSAVLLAGLFAEGETTVIEAVPSRDHTERMLRLETLEIGEDKRISVDGGRTLPQRTWAVPRDFSASAFFLVAGAVVPNAIVEVTGVGVNPSRAAALDVLTAMGANIMIYNERSFGGEPIADLRVRTSRLTSVTISGRIIPILIDEIPVLAVAAAAAAGVSEIRDAGELRVKESDRIALMVRNLRAMGADVDEHEDGMTIRGGRALHGATVETDGDHRIAMAMGIAALIAEGDTTIRDAESADVSFPGFWRQLKTITQQ